MPESWDGDIKLLGLARNTAEGVESPGASHADFPTVIPCLRFPVPTMRLFVHGDAVGDVMFYGQGAGELPTASAVVGDVFETARNIVNHSTGADPLRLLPRHLPIKKFEDIISRYFLRMEVEDKPGVLATVASVLGNNSVSIEQVVQKEKSGDRRGDCGDYQPCKRAPLRDALLTFQNMSVVRSIPSLIRVYG